jgi:anaerobic selenocysteine-containing dehydrogenase
MSQTGANADGWLPARPGTEGALALGLAHVIMRDRLADGAAAGRAGAVVEGWAVGLPQFTPQFVEHTTGIAAARIEELARAFASSPRAVAIIGGAALSQTNGLSQAMAVNALNALVGSVGAPGGLQFTPPLPGGAVRESAARRAPAATAKPSGLTLAALTAEILASTASPIEAVLLDDVNPVFMSPRAWRVREALERVPFIASFASFLDETSILADLILPDHSFLESWMDAVPESGTTIAAAGVAPPVMRPLYATRSAPDVLLEVAKRLRRPLSPPLPWQQFEELLRERYSALPVAADVADAWAAAQERGGWWPVPTQPAESGTSENGPATPEQARDRRTSGGGPASPPRVASAAAPQAWAEPQFDGAAEEFPFHLLPYASSALYDGSIAHLPWLQEMPDPLTSAMWSNWIEINPATAGRLQVTTGDMVEIGSRHGSVRAPVVMTPGIAPDVVAMPIGQGHETFTRYASQRGSNPVAILAPVTEPQTGALAWAATRVQIKRISDGNGELILFAGSAVEHPHEHR